MPIATRATPMATKDIPVSRIGPSSTTSKLRTTTFCWEAPTKYWNAYCAASDSPIVTIIIWVSPRPRFRNGFHITKSWRKPLNPQINVVSTMPTHRLMPATLHSP